MSGASQSTPVATTGAEPPSAKEVFSDFEICLLTYAVPGATTADGKKVLALHDVMTLVYVQTCHANDSGKYSRCRWATLKKGRLRHIVERRAYSMNVPGRSLPSPGMTVDDFRVLMELEERHINCHFKQQVLSVLDRLAHGDTSMVEMKVQSKAGPSCPSVATGDPDPDPEITDDPLQHFPGSSLYYNKMKIADGRRAPEFKCSTFCRDQNFFYCGGCPTCNHYWHLKGIRNYNVARTKQGDVMLKWQYNPNVLAEHYAQVQANNPTWKLDARGRPIPWSYGHFKRIRIEAAPEPSPPASSLPAPSSLTPPLPAPPKPPAGMKKAYECSERCKNGYFFDKGGCPTCNAFWHGLGFRNPERPTCMRERVVVYDPKCKPVDCGVLDSHFEELARRYPEWDLDALGRPAYPAVKDEALQNDPSEPSTDLAQAI
jgi:hypothetical protein